ncbi:MAG: hypothetical protein JWP63_1770, partial [Candidatus Solibacter sp.]|nr:hypothetical protein [Candidatus Solibacter sp.]
MRDSQLRNDHEGGDISSEREERSTFVASGITFWEYISSAPPRHSTLHTRIIRDLMFGVLLSAFLAGGMYFFGRTDFGKDFSWITYRFLQRRLTPPESSAIAIVDISELQQNQSGITPRDSLKKLLNALATAQPRVIGIDVDFSLVETDGDTPGAAKRWQLVLPDDYLFFQFCKQCCKNLSVPVYLGVYRTLMLPPEAWLGSDQFMPLAAALIVPERADKAFQSFGRQPGLTMSSAIAGPRKEEDTGGWFFQKVLESESAEIQGKQFVVDYSLLERLKRGAIKVPGKLFDNENELTSYFQLRRQDVENKRVLIGDVEHFGDSFEDPTRGRNTIPGILIHAAAAQTQLARPLYEIPQGVRQLADFLLAVLILSSIAFLRLSYGEQYDENRLLALLTGIAVALTLAVGITVDYTRVLWDDFLIVAVALLLHPFAHRIFQP